MRERSSVVVVHAGRLLTVRLEDPTTKVAALYPPGGMVEPGEPPAACAARETLEETGYEVVVDEASCLTLDYDFTWDGRNVECRTHFFRAALIGDVKDGREVHDASYHRGVEWLPLADVETALAYHAVIADAVRRLTRG